MCTANDVDYLNSTCIDQKNNGQQNIQFTHDHFEL